MKRELVGCALSPKKQAVKHFLAVLQHIGDRKSAKNFYRSHGNGRKTSGQLMLHRSYSRSGYPAHPIEQAVEPLLIEMCGQDMLHEQFQFMGKITYSSEHLSLFILCSAAPAPTHTIAYLLQRPGTYVPCFSPRHKLTRHLQTDRRRPPQVGLISQ